ncbi:NAD(+) diphosphatase [Plantibacter flavus]|uniref:NAD(+) diphosphatase n=1 Tax=Plantibacter flavus TaxID=150123 RepID=UPI003F15907A
MTIQVRALAGLPLARGGLDRHGEVRSRPGVLDELRSDPTVRAVVLRGRRALVTGDALELMMPSVLPEPELLVYLGRTTEEDRNTPVGTGILLWKLADDDAASITDDESRWLDLRRSGHLLSDQDVGVLATSLAIAGWHEAEPFCAHCGSPTTVRNAGWARYCPVDGTELFPRMDPAVIVAVVDPAGRILLGSNAMWEHNRYSLLAGYVDAGESLEQAVVREIFEESGMRLGTPVYLGSQPWPFPRSLMLGFVAPLADDQDPEALVPDGQEILDLRWFTREELEDPSTDVILPGPSSIARAVIDDWMSGSWSR